MRVILINVVGKKFVDGKAPPPASPRPRTRIPCRPSRNPSPGPRVPPLDTYHGAMSRSPVLSAPEPDGRRPLWIAYGCACGVAWLLYVLAGAEFQRGLWQLWQAVYQATLSLWAPMVLGVGVLPWVRRIQHRQAGTAAAVALHAAGALVFGAAWQACDYAVSAILYGHVYANVTLV